jgi:Dimerisation domain
MRWVRRVHRPTKAATTTTTTTTTTTSLPEQHPFTSRKDAKANSINAAAASLRESSLTMSSSSTLSLEQGAEQPPEPSIEHIRNTTIIFWASRVLTTMVEMDLFTERSHHHPQGMTHAEIVQLLCLHEDLRPDFLDTLVSKQILVRTGHGSSALYTNSDEANVFLVKTRQETYIGDTLLACGTTLYTQFIKYPESFRNEKVECANVTEVLEHRRAVEERLQPFVDQSGVSPQRILDLAFAFVRARVLHAAVELGLYETLDKWVVATDTAFPPRSMTAVQITKVLKMPGPLPHTVDFLEAAVKFDLLSAKIGPNNQRFYSNTTETACFLVPSNEVHYYGRLVGMLSARAYPFWVELPDALTTGLKQNETIRRKTFEELYFRSPPAMFD